MEMTILIVLTSKDYNRCVLFYQESSANDNAFVSKARKVELIVVGPSGLAVYHAFTR